MVTIMLINNSINNNSTNNSNNNSYGNNNNNTSSNSHSWSIILDNTIVTNIKFNDLNITADAIL